MTDGRSTSFITGLDDQGLSKFVATDREPFTIETLFGRIVFIYSNTNLPPRVTADNDLQETNKHRETGLPNFRVVLDGGVAAHIVDMKPIGKGVFSPMHRTRSLDLGIVVDGEVELELDGHEKRRLIKGDTIVQRGTMHKWINVTPDSGWARVFFVSLDALPIQVAGRVLEDEWKIS